MQNNTRKALRKDIPAIKKILNTIELFPAEMLENMISDYLNNSESEELWFVFEENNQAIGFGYCAPEKLTNGTFNLYAIGVQGDIQSKGIGSKMMSYLEKELADNGARVLIVETSSTEDFKLTRRFYEKLDYTKEAVIRDFWDEGDDKVIFRKKIN